MRAIRNLTFAILGLAMFLTSCKKEEIKPEPFVKKGYSVKYSLINDISGDFTIYYQIGDSLHVARNPIGKWSVSFSAVSGDYLYISCKAPKDMGAFVDIQSEGVSVASDYELYPNEATASVILK